MNRDSMDDKPTGYCKVCGKLTGGEGTTSPTYNDLKRNHERLYFMHVVFPTEEEAKKPTLNLWR